MFRRRRRGVHFKFSWSDGETFAGLSRQASCELSHAKRTGDRRRGYWREGPLPFWLLLASTPHRGRHFTCGSKRRRICDESSVFDGDPTRDYGSANSSCTPKCHQPQSPAVESICRHVSPEPSIGPFYLTRAVCAARQKQHGFCMLKTERGGQSSASSRVTIRIHSPPRHQGRKREKPPPQRR